MSLDKILERELSVRRRSRYYLAGFTVAVLVVVMAIATSI
jgi:hypothetical protein